MANKKISARKPVNNTRGIWDLMGGFFGWR